MSVINGAISATKTADCFSYGECFTATIPLHAVTKLDVAPQAILWLIKAREKRWTKKEKKGEGKPEGNDRGKNKGGERAAPALPTPSLAHHLLLPAATAILHHNRTSTAQRKREKQKRERDSEGGQKHWRENETVRRKEKKKKKRDREGECKEEEGREKEREERLP